ncbi:response regulator [Halovenus rubra]|uniref:Response regulator n=2 Tax=Halovenus rubra TaxID=869890 RepID=A0ABD5XCK5_9EURY|nr:response regulator [Halovenus rubra]
MEQDVVNILHVDDEPIATDLCKELLESKDFGFAVETANSAKDGLTILDSQPVDCIVSDYNMPGTDGLEFLASVRNKYPELPFILFTGKGSEAIASEAVSAGVTDYLQKGGGTEQYELLANRIRNAVEQHHSEQQLQETRKEYAAVFKNARSGLLLIDVEPNCFRFRRCNPQASNLTGIDEEQFIGKTPRELLGPEGHKKVTGAYRACVNRREPVEYTVTLDHPVGEVVHESIVTPVITAGEVEQLVVAFVSITDRRESQKALRVERAFSQHALDALADPCAIIDTENTVVRWNDRILRLSGYTPHALDESNILELFPESERQTVTEAIRSGERDGATTTKTRLQTADGTGIDCSVTITAMTEDTDNTVGLFIRWQNVEK